MQLDRYLGLYLSETQDRLRALNRSLLELETGGGDAALDEAFRAAHTLKGMAAAMGFQAVAEVAHALEDRLDEIRAGRLAVSRAVIDELLARADRLERENEVAIAGGPEGGAAAGSGAAPGAAPAAGVAPDIGRERVPEGTALIVRVALDEGSPLKAARAMIVCRNAGGVATVLGTLPAEFGDDFDGHLTLYVGAGADREALAGAIRAAGEVAAVRFEAPGATRRGGVARGTGGRTGWQRVRIDQRHLIDLADGIGDLAILCGRLEAVAATIASEPLDDVVDRIRRRVRELEQSILAARMVPVGEVFDRFPRVVRDAARGLGKEVDFVMEGREIELDREILEELADPLIHLLRNAIDHGLERPAEREAAGKAPAGRLVLRAARERSSILIEVSDDGRGVARGKVLGRARELGLVGEGEGLDDDALLRLLSQPGLSTAERVTDLSGRGVGLDVVVNRIRALGGAIALHTEEGRGTTFSLRLPTTLALMQALRIRVGGEDYAIPLTHIAEAVVLESEVVEVVDGREQLRLRGDALPLVRLGEVLGAEGAMESAAVVAEVADRRAALAVDELVGREQIVVKPFDAAVGALPIFSGATILADGRPALVLDPISVL